MVARLVGLVLVLTLTAGALAAPALGLDGAMQAKVRKLQAERRDALKKVLWLKLIRVGMGRDTAATVVGASRALLEAELDLAIKPAERLAAHATHLDVARYAARVAESMHRAGVLQEHDYQLARAARLEAEINWLKAGGKGARKEKSWKELADSFADRTDRKE